MYYAGIDAHALYFRVVVLDKDGRLMAEGTVSAREEVRIVDFLRAFRPLQVVVETCPFWPWVRDALEAEGVVFQLADARQLRAIAQQAQKNDSVDAQLLARMLLAGLIPPAHAHAAPALDRLRLVRHFAWLTRYRTMCANRIHAQLHQSGIPAAARAAAAPRGQGGAPSIRPEAECGTASADPDAPGTDQHAQRHAAGAS